MLIELTEAEARLAHLALGSILPVLSVTDGARALILQARIACELTKQIDANNSTDRQT